MKGIVWDGLGKKHARELSNLLLMKKELVEDMKVSDSLVYRDCDVVQFKTLKDGSKTNSRIRVLDFRRPNMNLFRDLLGSIL